MATSCGVRPPAAGSACLCGVRSLPDGAGERGLTPARENRTTVFPVPRLQSPGPARSPVLNTIGARNGELGCRKSSRLRGRRWGRGADLAPRGSLQDPPPYASRPRADLSGHSPCRVPTRWLPAGPTSSPASPASKTLKFSAGEPFRACPLLRVSAWPLGLQDTSPVLCRLSHVLRIPGCSNARISNAAP